MTDGPIWHIDNNSDTLLTTFGGIRLGVGMPTFEFMRSLSALNVDKMYLRDFEQAWYQKGIHGFDCMEHLAAFLTIEARLHRRTIFLGNSMGGFGAILYGILSGAHHVLAFAPQTFIGRAMREKHGDRRWRKEIPALHKSMAPESPHYDLRRVMESREYETTIDIWYSPAHALDTAHALHLEGLSGVTLHPEPEGGHGVIKVLRDDGRLMEKIKKLI